MSGPVAGGSEVSYSCLGCILSANSQSPPQPTHTINLLIGNTLYIFDILVSGTPGSSMIVLHSFF